MPNAGISDYKSGSSQRGGLTHLCHCRIISSHNVLQWFYVLNINMRFSFLPQHIAETCSVSAWSYLVPLIPLILFGRDEARLPPMNRSPKVRELLQVDGEWERGRKRKRMRYFFQEKQVGITVTPRSFNKTCSVSPLLITILWVLTLAWSHDQIKWCRGLS